MQPLAEILKTLDAALEHVPQFTREILVREVRPHIQALEESLKQKTDA